MYTLQEYYESADALVPYGQDYQPKARRHDPHGDSSPFGQHVNVVLVNDVGTLTTVGGNENNKVALHRIKPSAVPVGFGVI